MALACWMLRAWWRRQSAGNKSPHSMNVRRRLPSSWAGIRDLCFDSGLSLIPPLLSHVIYFCLSSGIDFFHTDSRSYFNGCHFPYRGSPRNFLLRFLFSVCSFISTTPCVSFFSFLSWQAYSSGLSANVCAWDYRLLQQGPAARRLCGARRGPG